ncbi:MAG TPA: diadenylate cyclase CdaA [Bryobacteraceae bacterium]|jgi:diadenylate cyclase
MPPSLLPGDFDLTLPPLTWTAALDILIVAALIYQLLLVVRGTRAAHILAGIAMVGSLYGIAILADLEAVRLLLSYLIPYTPIAVIILFQSEIRRTLARMGRRRFFGGGFQRPESLDEILLAIKQLSQEQTGGLIVLERDIGLRTFIESGVGLDAAISRDLICTVFMPGTALHDGAIVIQKDRIAAAACFLPLTVNPALAGDLGTRHRAAIGITEEADCLSLIVSEETGWISIAAFGELHQNLKLEQVDEAINRHFGVGKFKSLRPSFGATGEQERVRDAAPHERVSRP